MRSSRVFVIAGSLALIVGPSCVVPTEAVGAAAPSTDVLVPLTGVTVSGRSGGARRLCIFGHNPGPVRTQPGQPQQLGDRHRHPNAIWLVGLLQQHHRPQRHIHTSEHRHGLRWRNRKQPERQHHSEQPAICEPRQEVCRLADGLWPCTAPYKGIYTFPASLCTKVSHRTGVIPTRPCGPSPNATAGTDFLSGAPGGW